MTNDDGAVHNEAVFVKHAFDVGARLSMDAWTACCARTIDKTMANARRVDGTHLELVTVVAAGQAILLLDDERSAALPINLSADAKTTTTRVATSRTTSSPNGGYACDRCKKVFTYEYYRDKHLKYTRCVDHGDRKYPCPRCPRYALP